MALVSPVEAPVRISDAIRKASEATGTNFDYLLTTAARESNFKAHAKARTSSAAGLFQFIESTWLQTVKEEGRRFGLGKYEPHIFKTSSGRYYVPNRQIRDEILKLRHDPEVSAVMAGAFTRQNAEYVSSRLGREPTQGELYIAHFLGANGATRLITLASKDPNARAASHFPRAANANRGIFYSGGKARSAAQVYELLISDHSKLEALTLAAASPVKASSALPEKSATEKTDTAAQPALPVPNEEKPVGLVATTRVAALGDKAITVSDGAIADTLGSIGPWHTIVKPADAPAAAQTAALVSPAMSMMPVAVDQPKAAGTVRPTPLPDRRPSRPAPVPEPDRNLSAAHKPVPAHTPAPAVARQALDNFSTQIWVKMALYGH